jgi:hypothetical protein
VQRCLVFGPARAGAFLRHDGSIRSSPKLLAEAASSLLRIELFRRGADRVGHGDYNFFVVGQAGELVHRWAPHPLPRELAAWRGSWVERFAASADSPWKPDPTRDFIEAVAGGLGRDRLCGGVLTRQLGSCAERGHPRGLDTHLVVVKAKVDAAGCVSSATAESTTAPDRLKKCLLDGLAGLRLGTLPSAGRFTLPIVSSSEFIGALGTCGSRRLSSDALPALFEAIRLGPATARETALYTLCREDELLALPAALDPAFASAAATLLPPLFDSQLGGVAGCALARLALRSRPTLLEPALGHPSDEVRKATAGELAAAGEPLALLARALRDPDASVRETAAHRLDPCRLGAAIVPLLVQGLSDRSREVRLDSLEKLAELGTMARTALPALRRFRRAHQRPSEEDHAMARAVEVTLYAITDGKDGTYGAVFSSCSTR